MTIEHLIMHSGTMEMECKHCGHRYTPNLPIPMNMLTALTDVFIENHQDCKPEHRTDSTKETP